MCRTIELLTNETSRCLGFPDRPKVRTGEVAVVARPEAFTVDGGSIEATVEGRFYLGEYVRVTARLPNGEELTLRMDHQSVSTDETIRLSMDSNRVHLLRE